MKRSLVALLIATVCHADATKPKSVPEFTLKTSELQHPTPHLTESYKFQHATQTLHATYKVCLGTDGHVSDVSVLRGLEDADDGLMKQIHESWTYKPQPLPVCFATMLTFKIQ